MTMGVRSAQTAAVISPLLAASGIRAVPMTFNGQGVLAGKPPAGVDLKEIPFEPGGVLSIPLAFGDQELSAVGTITDVLPDGRVLAFGHAMFGQGASALPMANGFVHLVMPNLFSSFKLGGSGQIRGAIVRDENSAVIGTPQGMFSTCPVDLVVDMPGHLSETYHYDLVHDRNLTPLLASVLVMDSLTAANSLPIENTLRLHGKLTFTGQREFEFNSVTVEGTAFNVIIELFPVIASMMHNPHEPIMLESMSMHAQVQAGSRSGSLVNAQLDQREVEPGDAVGITISIKPYGGELVKKRLDLSIPAGLPAGDYDLILCDGSTYGDLLFDTHPHLVYTANINDFESVVKRLLNVSNEALYVVLQLPQPSLAIGRQEMPRLPSSRRAILETPANSLATSYREWVEKSVPMDMVLRGALRFKVEVR